MTNLLINDLAVASKELDHSAMLAVRGGADLTSFNAQVLKNEAKAGLVALATATNTLVNTNTSLDVENALNISPVTNVVVGGLA